MSAGEQQADTAAPTAELAHAQALVGQLISQRYRVDALIAHGGFGTVYRGEHKLMRKKVAIKVLQPGVKDLPALVERFRREAIVGAHVSHPNIAWATDFGQLDDGSYFLVLEHIKGRTLHEVLREEGAMPVDRAMGIARQVAAGLNAAHEAGVVHRDIKPHNIMLVDSLDGKSTASVPALVLGRDFVKVIDFGCAKLAEDRLSLAPSERASMVGVRITHDGEIFGTIAYLAPEAKLGMNAVDARSDLYALGVVCYQMLTGLHPFTETEEAQLFRRHLLTPPPPFAVRAPGVDVPPAIEALTMRLLEKDPAKRFQTASAVIGAIDEAMGISGALSEALRISSPAIPGDLLAQVMGVTTAPEPAPASARATPAPAPSPEPPAPAPAPTPAPHASLQTWHYAVAIVVAIVALGALMLTRSQSANATATPEAHSAAAPAESVHPVAHASASAAPSAAAHEGTPGDAIPFKHRLRASGRDKDWVRAKPAFYEVARLDPASLIEPTILPIVTDLVTALGQKPGKEADDVFDLLENKTGEAGLDVLYEVVQLKGGSPAAERATDILRRPEVMAKASKPLKIVIELRFAPCHDKQALLDRAVAEGDARVLKVFDALKSACGASKAYDKAKRDLFMRLSK